MCVCLLYVVSKSNIIVVCHNVLNLYKWKELYYKNRCLCMLLHMSCTFYSFRKIFYFHVFSITKLPRNTFFCFFLYSETNNTKMSRRKLKLHVLSHLNKWKIYNTRTKKKYNELNLKRFFFLCFVSCCSFFCFIEIISMKGLLAKGMW